MKPYPVDRLTAALLILAGAAAPGAVVTYHLGSLGLLGALCFVLSLIYIVNKNFSDCADTDAATGATERLDDRFPEVYARDVATRRLYKVIAVEGATSATERLDEGV